MRIRRWQILFSHRTRLSRFTILGRVIRLYRQSGGKLESLYPMGRNYPCAGNCPPRQ
ncbi:hypothetical protein DFAR_560018 [Desulfarculales bacterium]